MTEDEPAGFGADSVAITSDDVGNYGLKVLAEDGELTLVKYERGARGDPEDAVTEISFDQRLAPFVAKCIEGLDEGHEFVPMQDRPPEERQPICPNCCHNGAFDGQGHDRHGRSILRCAECDTTMHLPE